MILNFRFYFYLFLFFSCVPCNGLEKNRSVGESSYHGILLLNISQYLGDVAMMVKSSNDQRGEFFNISVDLLNDLFFDLSFYLSDYDDLNNKNLICRKSMDSVLMVNGVSDLCELENLSICESIKKIVLMCDNQESNQSRGQGSSQSRGQSS